MSWPALLVPGENWIYMDRASTGTPSNIRNILGSTLGVPNEHPAAEDSWICYMLCQRYTGVFLYSVIDSYRTTAHTSTTFLSGGKVKLAAFIQKCTNNGLKVGIVINGWQAEMDSCIDYNNTAAVGQKISAIISEDEFWNADSFNTGVNVYGDDANTGVPVFTVYKANLVAKKAALNAAGIILVGYLGYTKSNGFIYPDGSVVTGGDQIVQLQGVLDVFGLHCYHTNNVAAYAYIRDRCRQFTANAVVWPIFSAESTARNAGGSISPTFNFSGYLLEGRDPADPAAWDTMDGSYPFPPIIYSLKGPLDLYRYVVESSATFALTPVQTGGPRSFNQETDANLNGTTNAFVTINGMIMFTQRLLRVIEIQNGLLPVTAGIDITLVGPAASTTAFGRFCDDNLPYNGGAGPLYSYLWTKISGPAGDTINTPFQLTTLFNFIAAGVYVYRLTVSDGDVTDFDQITITVLPASVDWDVTISVVKTISCNGQCNGELSAVVTGTLDPPYTYAWTGPGGFTSTLADITGLCTGTYTVIATDNSGNDHTASVFVSEPPALVAAFITFPVSCGGGSDGAVDTVTTGGTTPYTWSWTGPGGFTDTNEDISGLIAGTYHLTITDAIGCTYDADVEVAENSIFANEVISPPTCNGGLGDIFLFPSGGIPAYTFLWNTGATTQNLNGVVAGSYDVDITDSNGCTDNFPITLTEPLALTANIIVIGSINICLGDTVADLQVDAITNGTAPYTYAWTGPGIVGVTDTILITVNAGGLYVCTVTDANGCQVAPSQLMTQSVGPATPVIQVTGVLTECLGSTVTLTEITGLDPAGLSWSDSTTGVDNIVVDYPDNFTVTYTDANGCFKTSDPVTVAPAIAVTITIDTVVDNVCAGPGSGGAIDVTVTGGCAPYTYAWTGPGGFTSNVPDISGLVNGVYDLLVTDNNGNTDTAEVTIVTSAPSVSALTFFVDCFAALTGSIITTASGGSAPYTYLWSNGATTANLTLIGVGTYSVLVTDALGCTATGTWTISGPLTPLIIGSVITYPTPGLTNGSITVFGQGGTAPYTYLWNTGSTSPVLNNIGVGIYTVTVVDANGCIATATFVISDNGVDFFLTVTHTDASCIGNNDGTATAIVSGGTGPYTFLWDDSNAQDTAVASGLIPGTYTVIVVDALGLVATATVTVGEVNTPCIPVTPVPDDGFIGETIAWSRKRDRWVSRYSFHPEYYGSLRNEIVSFVDGKLWLHDVNPLYNNFYGVQYRSRIEFPVNKNPNKDKIFIAIALNSKKVWYIPQMRTVPSELYPLGMESMLPKVKFRLIRDKYFSDILRDMNTPYVISQAEGLINGRPMTGQNLNIILETDETELNTILAVEITYIYSEKS